MSDNRPTSVRFMAKVLKHENGCWLWQASGIPAGYGTFSVRGKKCRAHRVSYGLFVGPVPAEKCVLHKCDTPKCVNPEHLFLGTHLDNVRDKIRKGRARNGAELKTHCPHGHKYSPENTYTNKGRRFCRACHNARGRSDRSQLTGLRADEPVGEK